MITLQYLPHNRWRIAFNGGLGVTYAYEEPAFFPSHENPKFVALSCYWGEERCFEVGGEMKDFESIDLTLQKQP